MRKKFISILMACLMLAISVPVFGAAQSQAQNPTQTSEDKMQEEISELRELVQMLLVLLQNQQPTQNSATADTPQISMQRAREIALQHVTGQGTIGAIMLFRENGVLNYEVNVATSSANYTIYINALTGVIIGNNRELITAWQPPVPIQTSSSSSSSTHTPQTSSSSTHTPSSSSSSSSRPSGR